MIDTAFHLSQPVHQYRLGLKDEPRAPASLADRHRPATLAAMVGQGLAVFRLETYLECPYSAAFLFEGPTGVGKTSAALAIASELGAVEFGGLETIKSGMQDAEAVENVLRGLRYTPMMGSGWKVVVVDEADYMSPKASQVWLSALEDLPSRSVVIFTTNRPEKFPDRFLDRCERISFEADARSHSLDAQTLIREIWAKEVGPGTAPLLDSLSGVVDSEGRLSYRRVVRALEPIIAVSRKRSDGEPLKPVPAKTPRSSSVHLPRDAAPCVDCGTNRGETYSARPAYERIAGRCRSCYQKFRAQKTTPG